MPVFLGDGVVIGRLNHSESTTEVPDIAGTEVELTDLRCDFTVPGNAPVWVEFKVNPRVQSATASATADIYIDVVDSTSAVQRVGGGSQAITSPGGAGGRTCNAWGLWLLDPGDYQARVLAKRTAGLGTVVVGVPAGTRLLLLATAV